MVIKEFFALLGIEVDKAAFAEADLALNAVKTGMGLLAGAVVAASAALGVAVSSVTHHAGEVKKLSTVMGVSTDVAQEWSYASQKAGVNLMLLERGSERLSANLMLANEGSKKAAAAFAALGIKTRDASGKVISTQAAMEGLVAGLEKMKDGGEKTARVQELLGKGGINLLPMLNKGSAAFAAMGQEARDLGLILDHDTIMQGAELTKQWRTLGAVTDSIKQKIGAELLPVLLEFTKGILEWWKENQKLIRQRLHTVLGLLLPVLKTLVWSLKAVGAVVGFLIDNWRLFGVVVLTAVIMAVQTLTADMVFLGIESVLAAGEAAIAWLVAAAPIVGMAAAIALVILLLDDIYGFFSGKDSFIGSVIDGWKASWSAWLQAFTEESPGDPWWLVAIKEALKAARDLIDELARLDPSRITDKAKEIWNADVSVGEDPNSFRQKIRGVLGLENNAKPFANQATPEQEAAGAKQAQMLAGLAQAGQFGGAAQGLAQTFLSPQSTANSQTTINAPLTINASGQGDFADFAKQVSGMVKDHIDGILVQAKGTKK